jgi:hypothetical protein
MMSCIQAKPWHYSWINKSPLQARCAVSHFVMDSLFVPNIGLTHLSANGVSFECIQGCYGSVELCRADVTVVVKEETCQDLTLVEVGFDVT